MLRSSIRFRSFFLILIIPILFLGCSKEQSKEKPIVRPVKSMVIGKASLTTKRSFPGKVQASEKAMLTFQVSGELIKLSIREGQDVKKGQLLAQLDPAPYKDKVSEARARYNLTKVELERFAKLLPQGHVTQSDYDKKKSDFQIANADLDTAKRNLEYTFLRSPFTGTVAKKYVENYQRVKAKEPILLLQNLKMLDVRIDVPENVIIKLKKNENPKIYILFESFPEKKFPATFKEFSTKADPQTQTYNVIVSLPAPAGLNVLPGMTATLITDLSSNSEYLMIPSSAVFSGSDEVPSVWLIDMKTMTIKKQSIKTGKLSTDSIQVISGLKSGDRIVTAGVHFLKDGMKVNLLQNESQGNKQ